MEERIPTLDLGALNSKLLLVFVRELFFYGLTHETTEPSHRPLTPMHISHELAVWRNRLVMLSSRMAARRVTQSDLSSPYKTSPKSTRRFRTTIPSTTPDWCHLEFSCRIGRSSATIRRESDDTIYSRKRLGILRSRSGIVEGGIILKNMYPFVLMQRNRLSPRT